MSSLADGMPRSIDSLSAKDQRLASPTAGGGLNPAE